MLDMRTELLEFLYKALVAALDMVDCGNLGRTIGN